MTVLTVIRLHKLPNPCISIRGKNRKWKLYFSTERIGFTSVSEGINEIVKYSKFRFLKW